MGVRRAVMGVVLLLMVGCGKAAAGADPGSSSSSSGASQVGPAGYGATCQAATQCGGRTPACAANGACVECTTATDCTNSEVCGPRGLCVECVDNSQCNGGQLCSPTLNRCVSCTGDAQCPTTRPTCSAAGECVASCTTATQCGGDTPVCVGSPMGVCAACGGNADCPATRPLCDPAPGVCRECLGNQDCGAARPTCLGGHCVQCIQNSQCGAGMACNQDLECVSACTSDAQCGGGGRPHCDPAALQCFKCVTNAHCTDSQKPICLQHDCVECLTATDCPLAGSTCRENQCHGP